MPTLSILSITTLDKQEKLGDEVYFTAAGQKSQVYAIGHEGFHDIADFIIPYDGEAVEVTLWEDDGFGADDEIGKNLVGVGPDPEGPFTLNIKNASASYDITYDFV